MAELRDVFRDAQAVVDAVSAAGATARPARPPTQAAIDATIATFTRTWRWRVQVPGTHPSGVTFEQLLTYLEGAGFDFLTETVQLRQAVGRALRGVFRGAPAIPTRSQMQGAAEAPLLEHLERRFEKGNGDVSMPRLQPSTLRAKARKGRAGYPIGVNTGALRAQFSRAATIVWL